MVLRFVELCAGLGGFHLALSRLGLECVFASELDDTLRGIYTRNFHNLSESRIVGDITVAKNQATIPSHDLLCAGFPCQPFSKSGPQTGFDDKERGTVFEHILGIITKHRPRYLILENVGNFDRHDKRRTWKKVNESLCALGYDVAGTEHKISGGRGLLSPHELGFPHRRERFFIAAKLGQLDRDPFPIRREGAKLKLSELLTPNEKLSSMERDETALSPVMIGNINHWNALLGAIPKEIELPSFPLWSYEWGATYPYEDYTPWKASLRELEETLGEQLGKRAYRRSELLDILPTYARQDVDKFPDWKISFIRQNREWYQENRRHFPRNWLNVLRQEFSSSMQKLEWNCQGEPRDLWMHLLQFRPSGLRTKRIDASPALVAMTTTQIPIIGPRRRFLSRREGLLIQGFPPDHELPSAKTDAFHALGNAVHVDVVEAVARGLIPELDTTPTASKYVYRSTRTQLELVA